MNRKVFIFSGVFEGERVWVSVLDLKDFLMADGDSPVFAYTDADGRLIQCAKRDVEWDMVG